MNEDSMTGYCHDECGGYEFKLNGEHMFSTFDIWFLVSRFRTYDGDRYILLRHGTKEVVDYLYNRDRTKYKSIDSDLIRVNTFVDTEWSLEEINKCINICDYTSTKLSKIV